MSLSCSGCSKQIEVEDLPEYVDDVVQIEGSDVYFLCKDCRSTRIEIQDKPVGEILKQISDLIAEMSLSDIEATFYIKWTCYNCGSRQSSTTPNVFHVRGYYCEHCRKRVFPDRVGYALIISRGDTK